MKRLLFRFLLFVGMLYGLERLNLMAVIVGIGVVMACMAFFHLLATPDAA